MARRTAITRAYTRGGVRPPVTNICCASAPLGRKHRASTKDPAKARNGPPCGFEREPKRPKPNNGCARPVGATTVLAGRPPCSTRLGVETSCQEPQSENKSVRKDAPYEANGSEIWTPKGLRNHEKLPPRRAESIEERASFHRTRDGQSPRQCRPGQPATASCRAGRKDSSPTLGEGT